MHGCSYTHSSICHGFLYLERRTGVDYYIIHSPIDNYIPFVEYFIVPYLLWFLFIAVTVGYFFFTDKWGFYRLCAFLFTGMTLFLLICTFFPNGLNLRPVVFERNNIFVDLVKNPIQYGYADQRATKHTRIQLHRRQHRDCPQSMP